MADTKIEWADKSWNPIVGCSKVGEGCRNCYAERMAVRLAAGLAKSFDVRVDYQAVTTPEGACKRGWNGYTRLVGGRLDEPRHWRKPRRIFVVSMGDLFHKNVRPEWIDRVLEVVAACPQHTFMALTKRPENIDPKLYDATEQARCRVLGGGDVLPNLWLGVSVENQVAADIRLPHLMELAAAGWTTFVSAEPLLEGVDFSGFFGGQHMGNDGQVHDHYNFGVGSVIVGGESGPGARPMHPDWPRSIRDQCAAAGVPFFLKQMVIDGRMVKMPLLDGVQHSALPE